MAPPKVIDYRKAAALLKHASDPTRLQALLILAEGEQHVGALHTLAGRQILPAFASHLTFLRLGGLVAQRRQGKIAFYALTDRGQRLVAVARALLERE